MFMSFCCYQHQSLWYIRVFSSIVDIWFVNVTLEHKQNVISISLKIIEVLWSVHFIVVLKCSGNKF